MERSLFQYRLLPSVLPVGVKTGVSIQALDGRQSFSESSTYEVVIRPQTRRLFGSADSLDE